MSKTVAGIVGIAGFIGGLYALENVSGEPWAKLVLLYAIFCALALPSALFTRWQ